MQPKCKWIMWSKYKEEGEIIMLELDILSEVGLGDWIEIRTLRSQISKVEMRILTVAMSTNIRI